MGDDTLPDKFIEMLDRIETSCVRESDPIRVSGFGGGPVRWRAEREALLDGVDGDGDILDVGCANGYLLECLMNWVEERALRLTPHGVDRSRALIELARRRLPGHSGNFHVGNSWTWCPPRQYQCIYALYDCVPL